MYACAHRTDEVLECTQDLVRRLQVLSHISERLAVMHEAGYVHRDLKPANVMWLPRQNRWTVIDFGCVARSGRQAPLSFTLAYAAPEVVEAFSVGMRHMEAQPALDAWALGVMAFELLTGAPAFNLLTDGAAKVCTYQYVLIEQWCVGRSIYQVPAPMKITPENQNCSMSSGSDPMTRH